MNLEDYSRIHMLGIGGIGMSALARFLALKGIQVTGYDKTETPLTQSLVESGIPVKYQADLTSLEGIDAVIYTPAVPIDFPEFVEAKQRGITMLKRSQVLGMISRSFRTVAIAGTHGKTSTTGLTTHLFRSSGMDVTGFVGGISRNYESNLIVGNSDIVIVEADEFDRSFLTLEPEVAIVTSMDADHLDIYGEADRLTESFQDFAGKIKSGGTLILQDRLSEKMGKVNANLETYGVGSGTASAQNLVVDGLKSTFDYVGPKVDMKGLVLNLPGRYNVENATAAITAALEMGCSPEGIREGLATFKGIRRRFEVRYDGGTIVHIDDYAHHPEEIRALMGAVRSMLPNHKVIAAFQPHLFSRTRDFAEGFAETLSLADVVVLLEIYPAREKPMEGVTSSIIFDRITTKHKTLTDLKGMVSALNEYKQQPAVILTIGAGDIDTQLKAVETMAAEWK